MDQYIHIGKVAATFGVKGELVVQHVLGTKTTLKAVKAVFIEELKGSYIPYFMEWVKPRTEAELLLKLEGVHTKEAAHRLVGKPVWLTEADFRQHVSKTAPVNLLGYTVYNEDEPVGPVSEVVEQPHQVLLKVMYKGHEALIPLHQETIDQVNHANKTLHLFLPDGLLEIYTH
jgi:16S rRNA processing protein RimM